MAIQIRRGAASDFDATKMVSGELAVSTDGTHKVWATGAAGDAWELANKDDLDAVEENLGDVEEDVADLKDAYEQIEADKADADGTYPDMTVGMAEQLDSDNYTEDSEPYHFRKSGGDSVRVGDREIDKIVGGTLVWNQLVQNGNFADSSNWSTYNATLSVSNNTATLTATQSANPNINQRVSIPSGHKSVLMYEAKGSANGSISYYINDGVARTNKSISANVWTDVYAIRSATQNATTLYLYTAEVEGYVLDVRNVQLIDLTALLGSTIADYIYSLEQSTAGAGVAFLRRYIDIDTYHPFDAGTLKSVEGLVSHDMVGFNQWDEEWEEGLIAVSTGQNTAGSGIRSKNFCRCVPGIAYFAQFGSGGSRYVFWYRADGSYIRNDSISSTIITSPNDACFFRIRADTITTYNHDICINLSDPAKNEQYEPYEKHSYPLDSSVTLRGVYKLVDGKLVADGDEYNADGTVTRRYGVVDLGTLNWTMSPNTSRFYARISPPYVNTVTSTLLTGKYTYDGYGHSAKGYYGDNLTIRKWAYGTDPASAEIYIHDDAYTDAATFKAAMSGVMLVYELATPTTEEAAPFTSPQWVDGSGTEQYVSTSLVPIGHYTQYPEDLKAKIEGLPWDFANLIAPTEVTYKATRNYTNGSLLIVNNILYKTTAAIANGGNITPGTNCTQTTLAAVIAAL